MSDVLSVEGLVKHFPIAGSRSVVQAVNGVSFTVAKGETLSLVGESGSGKTTVGRCVLGLIKSTDGVIGFQGSPVDRRRNIRSPELRGRLQLVFQEPAESLDPRVRVGETIAEPLRSMGVSRFDRRKRAREVAARVGLRETTLEQFPAELSAGQQQRVGIARAIVTDPTLLLCDEPTGDLDRKAGDEILDLLEALNRDHGKTIVMVTHDPRAAERARRTLHLNKGVLERETAA